MLEPSDPTTGSPPTATLIVRSWGVSAESRTSMFPPSSNPSTRSDTESADLHQKRWAIPSHPK
jgi:hypothetical protein